MSRLFVNPTLTKIYVPFEEDEHTNFNDSGTSTILNNMGFTHST